MLGKPILEITSLVNDQRRSGSGSFADSSAATMRILHAL